MRAVLLSHAYADPAARGKLKALAGRGVAVAAAVPDRWTPPGMQGHQKTTWGDESGVRTIPLPVRGRVAPGGDPDWSARALRRFLGEFRPDVLQIEEEPWSSAAATAVRVARKLRVPYVVLARESIPIPHGLRGGYRRSRVLKAASGLIGVNEIAVRLAIRGHPDLLHRVVPQIGVPLPPAPQRPANAGLAIGFFGRLIPEKGLDLLFRACVKLLGRWSITVVGTGPAQEELEGLAERLGIAGRVTWLGALPRDRVEEVWPRLDCVALPSRTAPRWVEVTPRAALEGMAHGLPIVASASGALAEIVDGGGTIVAEEDVAALTAALQRLLDEPGERLRLGAAGRQRIMDHFTDSAIAERTLAFWREAVGATG
jgi:glycosyltransferase involved in cell wall biosynthesis